MTKGPQITGETEQGQLIPPSFRLANKVGAAHYRLTLLSSLESAGDLLGVDKFTLALQQEKVLLVVVRSHRRLCGGVGEGKGE